MNRRTRKTQQLTKRSLGQKAKIQTVLGSSKKYQKLFALKKSRQIRYQFCRVLGDHENLLTVIMNLAYKTYKFIDCK